MNVNNDKARGKATPPEQSGRKTRPRAAVFIGPRRAPQHVHVTPFETFTCSGFLCAPEPTLLAPWLTRRIETALGWPAYIVLIQRPLLDLCEDYEREWSAGRQWRAHWISTGCHFLVLFRMLPWIVILKLRDRSQ